MNQPLLTISLGQGGQQAQPQQPQQLTQPQQPQAQTKPATETPFRVQSRVMDDLYGTWAQLMRQVGLDIGGQQ